MKTQFRSIHAITIALLPGFAACEGRRPAMPDMSAPEVTVSTPIVKEIRDRIEYSGYTRAIETVTVRPRVTGYVESFHFMPQTRIQKGQLLFVIDLRPFKVQLDKAEADVLARLATIDKAEFDAKRVTELMKTGSAAEDERVATASRLDAARADLAAARAAVEQAKLQLDYAQVKAPISGRISRNLVDPGNLVTADDTALAMITNDDDVHVYFDVSEQDALTVRDRIRAEQGTFEHVAALEKRPASMGLMNEEGYPHDGYIDYCDTQLNRSTGTVQVRARFPNPDGLLLPGLFARIQIPIGEPYKSILVTERAIGSDQGQRFLMVVTDKNIAEYRKVKIGVLRDGLRVITEGIGATDKIIVNGLQRVRPGMSVKPIEAAKDVAATQPAAQQTASTHSRG